MLRLFVLRILLAFAALTCVALQASAEDTFPVAISVNADTNLDELKPIWRFFGCDEPNYATMKNGRKLLSELGQLAPNSVFFRTHNLLSTGDGTPALKWGSTNAYREDSDGNAIYDWTITDQIFDSYRANGVRPYVQIGFMPTAMSVRPEPYQHHWKPGDEYDDIYTGWAYPPKSYAKWGELAYEWTKHCVERYGADEVANWYWQTWNEPDIGYWQGKPRIESFQKLHDFAIDGVRRALPQAKVGGPDAAYSSDLFREFLEHCLHGTNYANGQKGTPLDFVSFHAKGKPTVVDGRVQMGISHHLQAINNSMQVIASFPELKNTPIVIGESDPDGCAACGATLYPQNDYRNGSLYASYTAASFARKHELATRRGLNLEGALTWAFEFEDQPYFAGYRTLATNGLDKPVMNVFRMFSKMRGKQLRVKSDYAASLDDMLRRGVRDKPDVTVLACCEGDIIYVLVWHYHDDDVPGPIAAVELRINGLSTRLQKTHVRHFRVDDDHSNAFSVWKQMGSPQAPTPEQYAELEKAGQLAELPPLEAQAVDGKAMIELELPRQAVSLLILSGK